MLFAQPVRSARRRVTLFSFTSPYRIIARTKFNLIEDENHINRRPPQFISSSRHCDLNAGANLPR